ncbi:MAG: TIGR03885 family FMN-dependent LLM class oxidoreductase [Myxococcota bacterium]|nr:TIGR03885 family FMN-dependent LLM class oxidoreductase [Myxococcota bacterium]
MQVGLHASHEQHTPAALLAQVRAAESAGFRRAMCSDHFAPFSARQGQSGFAWSWLGAALEATEHSFGVVTAPGQRYHPVVLAQAIATLAAMYEGRLWVALGSGENLNEHITGEAWPAKRRRRERLGECVEILRALFAGETVTHDGLVRVHEAKLWTRPQTIPRLFGAAVSPESAAWVATWADGLVTVNQDGNTLARVVDAFRSAGGEGKPMYLQSHVAWAPREEDALAAAHDQWRTNVFCGPLMWDVAHPEQLDTAAEFVAPEDLRKAVRISADLGRHTAWLQEDAALGFDGVYLHEVGREQLRLFETFGRHVLPQLR